MNLLLDTCTFLWIISEPSQLSVSARQVFTDPGNRVYLSLVSAWEIAIKHSIGKLKLLQPPARLIPEQRSLHRIHPLPLREREALHQSTLPTHHRDPFDRMLVSQAALRRLVILTPDPLIRQYPVATAW
jgi:PIN domain nuclease of toxin-antitoxin system